MPDKPPGSPQLQRCLIVLKNFKADLRWREQETFLFAAMLLMQVSEGTFTHTFPFTQGPLLGSPVQGCSGTVNSSGAAKLLLVCVRESSEENSL